MEILNGNTVENNTTQITLSIIQEEESYTMECNQMYAMIIWY